MANLPTGVLDDVNLTKGGFYTHINTLIDFLSGAIGANGTKDGVKIHLELDSVDNTSDISKPISTLTQAALDAKQNTLVSGVSIKTVQGSSLLGSGNIQIEGVPSGVITMWSGSITSIPSGWYLCNGANGTPDLRGKFIYGASIDADVATTGGSADAVNVSHNHSGSTNTTGSHTHSISTANGADGTTKPFGSQIGSAYITRYTNSAGSHSHTVTVNTSGESGVGKNLPPYMKLAYIMKG